MSQKALQVVRLLEDFRREHLPESERNKIADSIQGSPEDHRAPKRPWEDMVQEGAASGDSPADVSFLCVCVASNRIDSFFFLVRRQQYAQTNDKSQSTAEQDMQIIRSKRATSTAGANNTTGQAKSKYRKRSVSHKFCFVLFVLKS